MGKSAGARCNGYLARLSCMDGHLERGEGCAVARGQDYGASVAALRIARSGFVERAEWDEDLARRAVATRRSSN
ncbi:hypothetical protein V5F53_20690 [Xanthobacter sp. V4C-4]|uniref:hypothetical protein n=1 Tax=Xanthobacter cornucopiae TaxID=3119924 RepID=UPI00372C07C1